MNLTGIENYLRDRSGYLKKGAESLADIMESQGYVVSVDDCAEALKNVRRESKETLISREPNTITTTESPIDLSKYTPVKAWGREGQMSYSYELKSEEENEEIKAIVSDIRKKLEEYSSSRVRLEQPKVKGSDRGMVVLTDLHIGALVGSLVRNTQEYSIEHVVDYLDNAAERINRKGFGEVRVSILGDIIESFTGTNHPATWKELEEDGYGANVIIIAYEILRTFFSKINNLSEVYIIGGNHDRVTQKNDEDYEYGAAKMISYFLDRHSDYKVNYDHMIMTIPMDGIDYILSHGHLPMVKKNPEYIVLNYGKNRDNFAMILTGHWHSRQKTEQVTNKATILADAKTYRAYSCPSIFTGNYFSEQLGMSSTPGFMIIQSYDGKPEVTDITL